MATLVTNGGTFARNFDGPPEVSFFEFNCVTPAGALDQTVAAYVRRNAEQYN